MKTVFCDESGSTGNNLWQPDQPYFVYSAVAIESDAATAILDRVRRDFRIQSPEFHTAQLLRRDSGERAVRTILTEIGDSASVAVFHKRYSLAGKMFEYLIEPIISDRSTAFYSIGFQRFVATGLFLSMMVDEPGAAQAFQEFQEMMRTGDDSRLRALIDAMLVGEERRFLHQVATIVLCNLEPVREEISSIRVRRFLCRQEQVRPRGMAVQLRMVYRRIQIRISPAHSPLSGDLRRKVMRNGALYQACRTGISSGHDFRSSYSE